MARRLWLAPLCILGLSGFGLPGGGSCTAPPPDTTGPPVRIFPPVDPEFEIDSEGNHLYCLGGCNGKPGWEHPETGEKVLFVNPQFTSHIVELSRQEGRHLLAMLYEHSYKTDFMVRFHWEPGSIAFWDNRATAHIVPTDIPPEMHRSMQRITLAGDLPVGPDGMASHALSGATFQ